MSTCKEVHSLLEPYTDGELLTERVVEVEQHIENCDHCSSRVKFDRSLRTSVRKVVYEAAPPSSAFLARLGAALDAERSREAEVASEETRHAKLRPLSWRTIAPLAAAAALVSVWAASNRQDPNRAVASGSGTHAAALGAEPINLDQFLDDLVDHHLSPETPDVTSQAELEQLDPEVGVPVRLPSLAVYGARWEGASVVPINNVRVIQSGDQAQGASVIPIRGRRAALLRYHVGGHKMTLYVYDAAKVPIERRLQRAVRNEPVYVGWKRGFSIAATERRGVGYAVATDLDDRESAEIVASLHH